MQQNNLSISGHHQSVIPIGMLIISFCFWFKYFVNTRVMKDEIWHMFKVYRNNLSCQSVLQNFCLLQKCSHISTGFLVCMPEFKYHHFNRPIKVFLLLVWNGARYSNGGMERIWKGNAWEKTNQAWLSSMGSYYFEKRRKWDIQLSYVPGGSQRIYLNSFKFHYLPAAIPIITRRKK